MQGARLGDELEIVQQCTVAGDGLSANTRAAVDQILLSNIRKELLQGGNKGAFIE